MKKYLSIVCVGLILSLTACSQSATQEAIAGKPVIVTSFYPITNLVNKIVGNQADVVQLLPTGAEPHDYEPTPEQMKIIEGSELVIALGESMEPYTEKLEADRESKNKAFLDFTGSVIDIATDEKDEEEHHDDEKHEEAGHGDGHDHGGMDPHVWLSPREYLEMAHLIEAKINDLLPNINTTAGMAQVKSELEALDREFTQGFAQCETKKFVTSHEAFGYLARDYKLEQVAVAGISPEEEPTPKAMADIIELVKKEKLKAVYSEPLISPKLIDTIASETGAKTYLLHPLEVLTSEETQLGYTAIMRQNLNYLREGMGCK